MKKTPPSSKKPKARALSGKQQTESSQKPKVLAPEVLPAQNTKAIRRPETRRPEDELEIEPEIAEERESRDSSRDSKDESDDVEDPEVIEEPDEFQGDDDPAGIELSESELNPSLPSVIPTLEPEASKISSRDPLRQYLEELRKYPLLAPEEEFSLAMKLREETDPSKTRAVARALVTANLRLVVKIAFEYRTFYSNLLDLIQEGNVGLMKAVSKFDPTKGARLGYYASWWIRSYILKYLLDNFRLVRVGTTQAQKKLFYHLMREKEKLEAQGLLAGPKLLAEKLNVKEKDVIEMEQRLSGQGAEMSLDTPVDRSEGKTTFHLDLLAGDLEAPDDALARNQLLVLLRDKLPEFQDTLNEKELRILSDRLLAEDPKTLQEVADLYGLTRERARQIEAKVIEKLREFLRDAIAE